MPERITGEPDQFEEILKEYCEERFGKERPVEVVWNKLLPELDPTEAPETGDEEEKTSIFQAGPPRLLPANKPGQKTTWRQRGPFALVAALAITAIAGLVVVALVLAAAQGQGGQKTSVAGSTPSPKAVPTLTPAPNSFDLTYPGATRLAPNPSDPWPTGKLDMSGKTEEIQKMALATSDNYTKVVEYYRQLLTKNGFDIYASEENAGLCEKPPCPTITNLASRKGEQQIGLMILSPQSWLPLSLSTYGTLAAQAKDTDNIVMITVTGPGNASALGNNTAVPVSSPPATVLGDVEPAVTATPDAPTTPESPVVTVTNPDGTPATIPAGYPDLIYPGSKQLNLKETGPWISGQLDLTGKTPLGRMALSSPDGYTKIINYYQQLLTEAGFKITMPKDVPVTCDAKATTCYVPTGAIQHFIATKSSLHIEIMTFEAKDWNSAPVKLVTQLNLDGQISPPDTLVLITLASDN
ncbi:MAG: hypothetical protein J0I20_02415 [Chloroflexi bacterium]|nr:hypothetical protein [Chloroflexota bacterium]